MTPGNQDCARWHLRMADGKTYGPVTVDVLRSWAAQARVGPGTQVSSDGTTWILPETITELELEWMLLIRNRTPYGPLCRSGVVQLARDGIIASDTRVINSRTRLEHSVSELVETVVGAPATAKLPHEATAIGTFRLNTVRWSTG